MTVLWELEITTDKNSLFNANFRVILIYLLSNTFSRIDDLEAYTNFRTEPPHPSPPLSTPTPHLNTVMLNTTPSKQNQLWLEYIL